MSFVFRYLSVPINSLDALIPNMDVNKDLTPKDQDKDKDLTPKDQDKDNYLTPKDQDTDKDLLDKDLTPKDQDKDFKYVLKESLRPRTRKRTTARQIILIAHINLSNVQW